MSEPDDPRETIVVTGLPRAGTSLVMQVLEAGGVPLLADRARPADAHNPRGYFEYAPARAVLRDTAWLEAARGRAVKLVAPLVTALPGDRSYRVLFVERRLDEVVASQRAMLAAEAARRVAANEPADELLASLRADPSALAAAYARALEQTRAALEARRACRVLRLEHAALLAAPRREAARIAEFLDRALDLEAMAAAVLPVLWRQRS
jgi:hypothetical protein